MISESLARPFSIAADGFGASYVDPDRETALLGAEGEGGLETETAISRNFSMEQAIEQYEQRKILEQMAREGMITQAQIKSIIGDAVPSPPTRGSTAVKAAAAGKGKAAKPQKEPTKAQLIDEINNFGEETAKPVCRQASSMMGAKGGGITSPDASALIGRLKETRGDDTLVDLEEECPSPSSPSQSIPSPSPDMPLDKQPPIAASGQFDLPRTLRVSVHKFNAHPPVSQTGHHETHESTPGHHIHTPTHTPKSSKHRHGKPPPEGLTAWPKLPIDHRLSKACAPVLPVKEGPSEDGSAWLRSRNTPVQDACESREPLLDRLARRSRDK
eukprot:GDKI01018731.1.p1 GENE.GDKI01018731.1~~GDKI01018731.1.p1  ORF type:complete len:347 (-),score=66.61 GDKI01018731.1:91-1077(-)